MRALSNGVDIIVQTTGRIQDLVDNKDLGLGEP